MSIPTLGVSEGSVFGGVQFFYFSSEVGLSKIIDVEFLVLGLFGFGDFLIIWLERVIEILVFVFGRDESELLDTGYPLQLHDRLGGKKEREKGMDEAKGEFY